MHVLIKISVLWKTIGPRCVGCRPTTHHSFTTLCQDYYNCFDFDSMLMTESMFRCWSRTLDGGRHCLSVIYNCIIEANNCLGGCCLGDFCPMSVVLLLYVLVDIVEVINYVWWIISVIVVIIIGIHFTFWWSATLYRFFVDFRSG